MMVKIDDRESKSRQQSAITYFNKMGYATSVEHLVVGDYVFGDCICFEYKTASDMIGSIKNEGRIFRQARNMKQYEYSFVIVVGSVSKEINNQNSRAYWRKLKNKSCFTVKSWIGAYASLETYSDVLVVENRQQAWMLMDALVSKILADKTDVKMVDRPQNGLVNPVASFLSCIYVNDTARLSKKLALRIIEELELESLNDLLNISADDLLSIEGIGGKTADAVMEAII